jgi:hypothetical protein
MANTVVTRPRSGAGSYTGQRRDDWVAMPDLTVMADAGLGVTFFAVLFRCRTGVVAIQGLDADGRVLPP